MARSIPASEFKAKCLALLDEVAETREAIVVTKRGKPVARVEPADKPTILVGTGRQLVSDEALLEPLDETWEPDWPA